MSSFHPAIILLLGALLLPVFKGRVRQTLLVLLPLLGFLNLLGLEAGTNWHVTLFGQDVHILRVDKLSLLFGYLFHIAAFLAAIYSLHLKDRLQHVTGIMYAGSAIGATFAGDLLVLFIFWELLAVTSVFQIWARRRPQSFKVGMRYLLLHVVSGLLLLTGAAIQYLETGSMAFGPMELEGPAAWLILTAFGIKCCFPGLHAWLVDAYPEATPTGTVFLASFTTKTAIYALARSFAGAEELIWIGSVMAMFPIYYAVIENDMRRVLGYSLINQLGFMIVGIGLGEGMGVNGAVAHAYAHILYKGLLFMSMGAVLFRTGKINANELGNLYKSMPWTTGFCVVGAASISAFPLFSGFVSKSMVMQAAADQHYPWVWLILLFASAGVFHHAGIKIPFFAFFGHESGIRCKEAPMNMLIAMGISSFLCIFIGCFPGFLYKMLPYVTEYKPYTWTHVVTQLQLLFYSALAFVLLNRVGVYPPELHSVNLDADWTYRKLVPSILRRIARGISAVQSVLSAWGLAVASDVIEVARGLFDPKGVLGRCWTIGSSALIVAGFLAVVLFFYYLDKSGLLF